MKKLNFYLLFLGLLWLSACTDLEPEVRDSIVVTAGEGGTFDGDAGELLNSAYNAMDAYTDQANIYSLFEHPSDEMIPPTRGVDWGDNGVWRSLHTHTWDPNHSWILGAWNGLNERVFRASEVIAATKNAANVIPLPQIKAEAKFLRAFHMWHVMDLFGIAPFRGVNDGVSVAPSVKTRTEAFDFIVNDLTEALPVLPNSGPDATNYRATKAAANALLARLYLNRAVYKQPLASAAGPYTFDNADLDKVIQYCDAVTAAGYSLEPNYFDNFSTAASKEIILTSKNGTPQNRYYMTLHYGQNPSGWNGFTTLAEFYDKFTPEDSRRSAPAPVAQNQTFFGIKRGFLIGQQVDDKGENIIDSRSQKPLVFTRDVTLSGAATEKGIRVIKYHPANKGQYILLRYADVYLMKVEALFRKGGADAATALTMINNLRATRGAVALPSPLTINNILDERGRELYWEGIRRVDQIRFGTWTNTWAEKTVTEPKRVLYPIPTNALISNPNLVQNPGY